MADWEQPPLKPAFRALPLDHPDGFRAALVRWFDEEGLDYPWRRTHDPYAILVSEAMLQQTQVATVLQRRYFENWMAAFPDPASLAGASEDAVLKAWEGLGYYRRARNLQKAAQAISDRWDGCFPDSYEAIRDLPGVGDYTAGAVMAFAFDQPAPMVDGNVGRVLARLFDDETPVDSAEGRSRLVSWSAKLVDPDRARRFQSGIMELGQRVCLPKRPLCTACPVAGFCATKRPESLPVKRKRAKVEAVAEHVLWVRDGGRVYLERESGSRRRGFWRLPEVGEAWGDGREPLLRFEYGITRFRVTLSIYGAEASAVEDRGQGGKWCTDEEVEALALAAPYRKAWLRLRESATGGS